MNTQLNDDQYDFRTIILKHSFTEARDCRLSWRVDFGKMQIALLADFISPALILDFISSLRDDERFQKTGLTHPLKIGSAFRITLTVSDSAYLVQVYLLRFASENLDRLELEFIPVHKL